MKDAGGARVSGTSTVRLKGSCLHAAEKAVYDGCMRKGIKSDAEGMGRTRQERRGAGEGAGCDDVAVDDVGELALFALLDEGSGGVAAEAAGVAVTAGLEMYVKKCPREWFTTRIRTTMAAVAGLHWSAHCKIFIVMRGNQKGGG